MFSGLCFVLWSNRYNFAPPVLGPVLSFTWSSSCNPHNSMRYSLLLSPYYKWTEAQMSNNMLVFVELGFETLVCLALGSMLFLPHFFLCKLKKSRKHFSISILTSAVFDPCLLCIYLSFLGFHDLNFSDYLSVSFVGSASFVYPWTLLILNALFFFSSFL